MSSRRDFLGSIAATGAVFGAGTGWSPELPLVPEAAQPGPVPAPIAALKSMKDQMVPITGAERQARIEKARRLMAAQQLDAIILTGGTSLRYFTNIEWGLSERLLAVVIPARGGAFLVSPAFERDRAMEQVAQSPLGTDAEVMTWDEHESPFDLVASGLKARGATGTIGFEETVRYVFSHNIATAMPSARFTSGTGVTAGCRMVKSPAELALMRLASKVTLAAYEAAYKSLKAGMTQNDFGNLVRMAHDRLGFSGGAGVQVGKYSALPHGSITPQVISEGSILLIDGGCSVGGYASDISRTFVLGRATDRMKRVFEVEHRAQTAALKAARPGVPAGSVDAAARKVLEDGGFGPGYKFCGHRVGHGMGMDGHEWPYLVKDNPLLLEPGMTFSDEPGIYIPGEFGIRLEDDMIITENGAELMTPQSPSLETPFA